MFPQFALLFIQPEEFLLLLTIPTAIVWFFTMPHYFRHLEKRRATAPRKRSRSWQVDKKSGIPYLADTQLELERIRAEERSKSREMFERLALEKLDIIKTSVALGGKESELRELDDRLERVIGGAEMRRLLRDELPLAELDEVENERLRQPRWEVE
jgi:hypothetical protein